MSALVAVQIVALLSTGLKAGALFGDQLSVRFARGELSGSSFVKFEQAHLRRLERFMPALSSTALLFTIAWLALIWSRVETVSFILVALAALAHIFSLVLAITGCMPINRQLMSWAASAPPPDAMSIWARWEQVNAVRASLAVIALVSVVLALVVSNAAGG